MQIPKIFHYHSQYYVHYKSYKGREEERESESETQQERNRDRLKFQSNNKTPHPNISKFSKPNSLDSPRTITQHLKMAFITQRESETYRERKRVSWRESQPLQSAQHKHSEGIYDCAC